MFGFKHVKQTIWLEISRRVNSIVYYNGAVRDIEVEGIFSSVYIARLAFNSNIQLSKLPLTDPVKYEVFDVKSAILKLYAEFGNTGEGKQRLISVPIRKVGTKEEAGSPMTWLCGGFTTLLESSHYDIPESSMGKH
ncbi:hypothetical protein PVK06_006891 [Gossypium arboreum]|uniref:Uncharacterized protein n=1 Tax=Gossypium arboreum TaxID=29729 RepID=A0ABR0QFT2_GOSAR|nr:hypothetical protein PVK06_006891 [Gossypium arboreum]